jgi:hypothetical protein
MFASTLNIDLGSVPKITAPSKMAMVILQAAALPGKMGHGEDLYPLPKILTNGPSQWKEVPVWRGLN